MDSKPRFNLTVQLDAQADDPHGTRRLRFALKVLLRRFGIQCVDAYRVTDRQPNPDGEYSYPLDPSDGVPLSLADAYAQEVARLETAVPNAYSFSPVAPESVQTDQANSVIPVV